MKQNRSLQFIGVPFGFGTNRNGTQFAPNFFESSIDFSNSSFRMMHFSSQNNLLEGNDFEGVNNYCDVQCMISDLKEESFNALNNNQLVVFIGGDHSISIGSIAGVLKQHKNLAVIWIDAHADINTETSSYSGNAHGMPLAALMGLCKSKINNTDVLLNPLNVFWIGTRDIDEEEKKIIQLLGIENQFYTMEKINKLGMDSVMSQIRTILKNNNVKNLHLSFDIDVMDPSVVFATGTPVECGLAERDCNLFIQSFSNKDMPKIVSMDFVEYNPFLDVGNQNGEWCIKTLRKLLNVLLKK